METFALAAISLTIAASLFIKRNKRLLHITFASLCLGLFLEKTGVFFGGIFPNDFWKTLHVLGLLVIPPLLIAFSGIFLGTNKAHSKGPAAYAGLGSLITAAVYFPLLFHRPYAAGILYLYVGVALAYCLGMLVQAIYHAPRNGERKRLIYVAVACAAAGVLSLTDVAHVYHPGVPPLSDISLAFLIYFILVIITYPRLPELHEIMVRAAIVFLLTIFATVTFYLVLAIFGDEGHIPPFNLIFMTAFIIVIFIDPVKLILKKAGLYFFLEGKGSLNSLYTIDEEMEKEKSLLLEEMATTLAHEIRNPLGSIKGAAQYLRSDSDSAENRELFDVITSEIDRLNNVVSRFLSYAKPGAINPDTRSMSDILERIVTLITSQHLSEGIVIKKDIPQDLPAVWVDGEQMVQAVLNITLNAVEAMPRGGTLTLSARVVDPESGPWIEIAVEDTGEGIEKKSIKRLFKPFYTTKEKGTGIGLAISRRIVKAHGGTIGVTSSPGRGSVFHIRIPVQNP